MAPGPAHVVDHWHDHDPTTMTQRLTESDWPSQSASAWRDARCDGDFFVLSVPTVLGRSVGWLVILGHFLSFSFIHGLG